MNLHWTLISFYLFLQDCIEPIAIVTLYKFNKCQPIFLTFWLSICLSKIWIVRSLFYMNHVHPFCKILSTSGVKHRLNFSKSRKMGLFSSIAFNVFKTNGIHWAKLIWVAISTYVIIFNHRWQNHRFTLVAKFLEFS